MSECNQEGQVPGLISVTPEVDGGYRELLNYLVQMRLACKGIPIWSWWLQELDRSLTMGLVEQVPEGESLGLCHLLSVNGRQFIDLHFSRELSLPGKGLKELKGKGTNR